MTQVFSDEFRKVVARMGAELLFDLRIRSLPEPPDPWYVTRHGSWVSLWGPEYGGGREGIGSETCSIYRDVDGWKATYQPENSFKEAIFGGETLAYGVSYGEAVVAALDKIESLQADREQQSEAVAGGESA